MSTSTKTPQQDPYCEECVSSEASSVVNEDPSSNIVSATLGPGDQGDAPNGIPTIPLAGPSAPTPIPTNASLPHEDKGSSITPQRETGTSQLEVSPPKLDTPSIVIEYCDRCRWSPRAIWTQTELFLTLPTPTLKNITLIPLTSPETGGRFRVWCDRGNGLELVWDRKTEGGFPELKILKQRIRNLIQPDQDLGHSDTMGKTTAVPLEQNKANDI